MRKMPVRCDVLILGSGFAGSLLGAILARAGKRVVIVDAQRHPRFAIGESSTPIADTLLADLVTRHELLDLQPLCRFGSWQRHYPNIDVGCKRGFSYLWHDDHAPFDVSPEHRHELLVTASSSRELADTHWYRPSVDTLFANVASSTGAVLMEMCCVQSIEHSSDHSWRVTVSHKGKTRVIEGLFLVDASGNGQALANHLQIPDQTSQLQTRTSALFTHADDCDLAGRWLMGLGVAIGDHPYPIDDAAVHHLFRDGWLWRLRFESGRTSIGWVQHLGKSNTTPESWKQVCQQQPLLKRMLGSVRLNTMPGRWIHIPRVQRLVTESAGVDWAMLPFTAGSIDALHSTGIAHSLVAVNRLATILVHSPTLCRAQSLKEYSHSLTRELKHIDQLVSGCYRALSDFRAFVAWTMVYFASATTYEQEFLTGNATQQGFLLANNEQFCGTVKEVSRTWADIDSQHTSGRESLVESFYEFVRQAIAPFNHVGLFAPSRPNMYARTAGPSDGLAKQIQASRGSQPI
jgi:FADH2 O2-dependent halogenase